MRHGTPQHTATYLRMLNAHADDNYYIVQHVRHRIYLPVLFHTRVRMAASAFQCGGQTTTTSTTTASTVAEMRNARNDDGTAIEYDNSHCCNPRNGAALANQHRSAANARNEPMTGTDNNSATRSSAAAPPNPTTDPLLAHGERHAIGAAGVVSVGNSSTVLSLEPSAMAGMQPPQTVTPDQRIRATIENNQSSSASSPLSPSSSRVESLRRPSILARQIHASDASITTVSGPADSAAAAVSKAEQQQEAAGTQATHALTRIDDHSRAGGRRCDGKDDDDMDNNMVLPVAAAAPRHRDRCGGGDDAQPTAHMELRCGAHSRNTPNNAARTAAAAAANPNCDRYYVVPTTTMTTTTTTTSTSSDRRQILGPHEFTNIGSSSRRSRSRANASDHDDVDDGTTSNSASNVTGTDVVAPAAAAGAATAAILAADVVTDRRSFSLCARVIDCKSLPRTTTIAATTAAAAAALPTTTNIDTTASTASTIRLQYPHNFASPALRRTASQRSNSALSGRRRDASRCQDERNTALGTSIRAPKTTAPQPPTTTTTPGSSTAYDTLLRYAGSACCAASSSTAFHAARRRPDCASISSSCETLIVTTDSWAAARTIERAGDAGRLSIRRRSRDSLGSSDVLFVCYRVGCFFFLFWLFYCNAIFSITMCMVQALETFYYAC